MISAFMALLGGVVTYFISGRALKPLYEFSDKIEEVQAQNLSDSRIEENKWIQKEKLPRPFETASLLAPYLCLLYELLHVYFYLFRELRADGTFYVFTSFRFIPFFSGMPSLFQLANPFLPCRFSGGGNAELLQEYPATSPIIVSSVFFLKVNNPFYVRWIPFYVRWNLTANRQPSVMFGL